MSEPAPASPPPATPLADASPWRSLIITTAVQAMVSMALLALPAVAPAVAKALGVSATLVGVYVALCYVAAMGASLVGGTLVRRWGAIRVSQIGLVLCGVGMGLCATGWLPAMVLGALCVGAGYGPITPASSHLLALTTPAHRLSLVFSIKQTGVPLGGMLAGAVMPGLTLWLGWQGALALVALACVACVGLAQPLRTALDADRQPAQALAWRALLGPVVMVLQHPSLRVLAACSFLFSSVQVSVTAYLVTYLNVSLSMTLLAAGVALSVSQAAGVVGRIAWGALADRRLGPRYTLMLLAALIVVGSLLLATLPAQASTAWLWAVVALLGASAIGWNGVYLAAVARQAPQGQAGVATGGTLMFTFLGVVCGSPAFGALAAGSGSYRVAVGALAVPALLALGLLIWRAMQVRKAAQPPLQNK